MPLQLQQYVTLQQVNVCPPPAQVMVQQRLGAIGYMGAEVSEPLDMAGVLEFKTGHDCGLKLTALRS